MTRLGFVILSHENPHQLLRLCDRLRLMFKDCSIVCHHDFERCPIDTREFPSAVKFVRPSIRTFWGHISLIHAELAALRLLYDAYDPDWFYFLSSSDYPVRQAHLIVNDLATSSVDAYVLFEPIHRRSEGTVSEVDFKSLTTWHDIARHRYLETMLCPTSAEEIESTSDLKQATQLLYQRYDSLLLPVDRTLPRGIPCYAGEHWMTGNRLAARTILNPTGLMADLLSFFKNSAIPDEAIYQTLLCNSPGLSVANHNLRFVDWANSNGHPQNLNAIHLPGIFASGAHFARKFTPGAAVLDQLDRVIEG